MSFGFSIGRYTKKRPPFPLLKPSCHDPKDNKNDRKGGRYDEHSCRKVDKMMVGAVRLCRRNMPAVGEHLTECPAVS